MMKFTLDNYKKILINAIKLGYRFYFFDEKVNSEFGIYNRHDIDFSLEKALEIAELEFEIGVKSTFFVMLSSEFYNLHTKNSREYLEKIISLGHQIGLHYDEKSSKMEIQNGIIYEKAILENIINKPIQAVSMHRPSSLTLAANYQFEGIVNTYGEYFTTYVHYISDSRMNWQQDPEEAITSKTHKLIQFLTHPIWYTNKNSNIDDILNCFVVEDHKKTIDSIKNNIRNSSELKLKEIIK